jgi:hypothetical protein
MVRDQWGLHHHAADGTEPDGVGHARYGSVLEYFRNARGCRDRSHAHFELSRLGASDKRRADRSKYSLRGYWRVHEQTFAALFQEIQ